MLKDTAAYGTAEYGIVIKLQKDVVSWFKGGREQFLAVT